MGQIQTRVFPVTKILDQGKVQEFWRGIGVSQLISVSTVQVAQDTSFLIVTFFDDVFPEITRTVPRDGQSDVNPDTDIVIYFSEDITVSDASEIEIRRNSLVVPAVEYTIVVSGSTLIISGAIDATASSYSVTVGSASVVDASGNNLEADFTFQFSTINAATGSTIVDLINASDAVIDSDNVATNPRLRRKIRNNFSREIENRKFVLGADDDLSDVFFTDKTDDPGGAFVPSTTTAELELDQMRAVAATGLPSSTLYSSALPIVGATGCLLETDFEGVLGFKIHVDGSAAGSTISPTVPFSFGPSSSSVRFSATFSTTGSVMYDYALYLFT